MHTLPSKMVYMLGVQDGNTQANAGVDLGMNIRVLLRALNWCGMG